MEEGKINKTNEEIGLTTRIEQVRDCEVKSVDKFNTCQITRACVDNGNR